MIADELARGVNQPLSRLQDLGKRAVAAQPGAHHRAGRLARRDPGAGVRQELAHPGLLGRGPRHELVEIHGDAVGAAEQRGQPLGAQALGRLRPGGAVRPCACHASV